MSIPASRVITFLAQMSAVHGRPYAFGDTGSKLTTKHSNPARILHCGKGFLQANAIGLVHCGNECRNGSVGPPSYSRGI